MDRRFRPTGLVAGKPGGRMVGIALRRWSLPPSGNSMVQGIPLRPWSCQSTYTLRNSGKLSLAAGCIRLPGTRNTALFQPATRIDVACVGLSNPDVGYSHSHKASFLYL